MKMTRREDSTGRNVQKKEREYYDVIHAPYVEGLSEAIQRDLRKLQVGFTMKPKATIGKMVHKKKKYTQKIS